MTRRNILAIPGSIRRDSVNDFILKEIKTTYHEILDIKIYDELHSLPHFNPDIGDDVVSGVVKELRRRINEADGVIICTPEYVFSLPGALKNALEWTVSTTVFSNKPTAIIVAAGLGEKTFESLNLIMSTLGARIGAKSTLLIQGARSKISAYQAGDEQTKSDINRLVQSLMKTIDDEDASN